MKNTIALTTIEELSGHVLQVLCEHDYLDAEQTPLTHTLLFRRNRACGMFFQAHGPRLLKTYAVWAGDENRILFYDCNGSRFAETKLSESPDPGEALTKAA